MSSDFVRFNVTMRHERVLAENIITASNEGGNTNMSPAMKEAYNAAKSNAGTTGGIAIDLIFE